MQLLLVPLATIIALFVPPPSSHFAQFYVWPPLPISPFSFLIPFLTSQLPFSFLIWPVVNLTISLLATCHSDRSHVESNKATNLCSHLSLLHNHCTFSVTCIQCVHLSPFNFSFSICYSTFTFPYVIPLSLSPSVISLLPYFVQLSLFPKVITLSLYPYVIPLSLFLHM